MTMITVKSNGNFSKTTRFLERAKRAIKISDLDKYGARGVAALSKMSPIESGKTASSWYYKIENTNGKISISFYNSNIQNGVPIAIIIQYGHGTGTGGYVQGRDYINPAIRSIFDQITQDVWNEVIRL